MRSIKKYIAIVIILSILGTLLINCMQNISFAASNVIEISSAEDLWNFAKNYRDGNDYKGKTIKLTKNIDLGCSKNKPWVPIGYNAYAILEDEIRFNGVFDGNNYTIKNMYIDAKKNMGRLGFFNSLGENGIIKNVKFNNCIIEKTGTSDLKNHNIGIVVGYSVGKILNCTTSGCKINISKGPVPYGINIGGIVGEDRSYDGSISNCSSGTIINFDTSSAENWWGKLHSCGGIAGLAIAPISNCINKGSITNKVGFSGGIVGIYKGDIIINCKNTAGITAGGGIQCSSAGGGIVGAGNEYGSNDIFEEDKLKIYNCGNTASVHGTNYNKNNNTGVFLGGIIGIFSQTRDMTINNCYSIGNIDLDSSYNSFTNNPEIVNRNFYNYIGIGGIVGELDQGNTIINNTYSVGSVQSTKGSGSIVGYIYTMMTTIKCVNTYKTSTLKEIGNSTVKINTITKKNADIKVQSFVTALNKGSSEFSYDKYGINKGYPYIKKLENGWKTVNSKKYYFTNGVAATGVKTISGKRYYFDSNGVMVTNKTIGNYHYDANGVGTLVDKTAPKVTVKYSTTEVTKGSVKVTLTANEKVKAISGWTLSSDAKTLTKTYTGNTNQTVNVYDIAGNKTAVTVKITNIDKTAPTVTVKYSTTKLTNGNVGITVTANEQIQGISGWTLSKDKKTLTKTYTKNGTENITVKDLAGNIVSKQIKVGNIDKTAPTITVKYSTTEVTKGNVKVTITSNEIINQITGWTLSTDGKTLTKTYTKNSTEILSITDKAGNSITQEVKITNIDKTAPQVTNIEYSNTEKTNGDVEVRIKVNEPIQDVQGWKLETNKLEISKTYTENTEETIEIKDIVGNTLKEEIKINNIDKTAPKLEVTYSTKEKTNKGVKVTIASDEQINQIKGWTLSKDGKTLTKTYTKNVNQSLEISDISGNKATVNVKIENIDLTEIEVEVEYSKTELTNENVEVTIKANKEIENLKGWKITEDKKSISKEYEANKQETITIKDKAGNEKTVEIEISNIDKEAPEIELQVSEKNKTAKPVTVTITANELIQQVKGWEISGDGKRLTKEYRNNTKENVEIYDLAGNKTTAQIEIQNIEKKEEKDTIDYEIKYSKTEMTNEEIEVEIKTNETLDPIENWELSNDKKSIKRKYSKNTKEQVKIKSTTGKEEIVEIEINNIDKEKPKLKVTLSTEKKTTKPITVKIEAEELIQEVEGWKMQEDGKSISKEYSENTEEEVTVKDLAGNEEKVKITINNIVQLGDINLNNQIDIGDILLLLRHIAQENSSSIANKHKDWKLEEERQQIGDVNKNNKLDIGDILKIQRYIAAKNDEEIAKAHLDWLNL